MRMLGDQRERHRPPLFAMASQLVEGVGDEVVLFSVFLVLTMTLLVYLWLRGGQSNETRQEFDVPTESDVTTDVTTTSEAPSTTNNNEQTETVEEDLPTGPRTNEESTVRSRFQRPQADVEEEDGSLSIRLILPNNSTLPVNVQRSSTIGDMKRTYFQEQLAQNRAVRFIYQGRVLDDDTETLQHIGVGPHHAVHIHIGRPRPPGSQGDNIGPQQPGDMLDLSKFFLPLFVLILGICWVCMFSFPDVFSLLTKFILFLLSFVFIFIYFVTTIRTN